MPKRAEVVNNAAARRIVSDYLKALAAPRPMGRTVDYDAKVVRITKQLADDRLTSIQRLYLIQQRIDAEALAIQPTVDDRAEAEAAFVTVAAAYADHYGLSYAAFRTCGVPAAVLKQAGIARWA